MREYVRSRQYTWSAGARLPIDLSFLESTLAKYRSPVIEAFELRFTGSVFADSSTTFQNYAQCAALAQQFVWRDKRGERINLTGRELRLAAQWELGSGFQDPVDHAASTTNTSFEVAIPIVFKPHRARRRADTRPGVAEVLSGDITWTLATATPVTGVTINSGTVELHALVTDEVVPEAASRMCWLGVNATLAEDNYMIDGACRFAGMYAYAGSGAQDLTSLSTYTEIDSYTLDMVDVPRAVLARDYMRETPSISATDDEIVRNNVIPLIYPDRDQKLTQLRDLGKMHVRLQAALPTGGRLVYCVLTDRDPVLAAATLKVPVQSLADGSAPLNVVGTKGEKPADAIDASLARKSPLRRA